MRVASIHVSNICGIDELDIKPGAVTVLEGGNGVGKTSVVSALLAAIGSGHDATLLRKGAESGQVVIVFDDGVTLNARVTAEQTGRTITHPDLGKISKPAEYLKKLADALSVNPIEFLTAPSSKRAEILLEALSLEVTDEELAACGVATLPPPAKNGLDRIEIARKAAFEHRTGVNRAAKEKQATVRNLAASLPQKPVPLPDDAELVARRKETEAARKTTLDRARLVCDTATENAQRAYEKAIDAALLEKDREATAAKAAYDAAMADVQARYRKTCDGVSAERDRVLAAAKDALAAAKDALQAETGPKLEALAAEEATVKAAREQALKDQNTREVIGTLKADVEALEVESATDTATIEALDRLQTKALETLPIRGLEVRNGRVLVDGVDFDRVNRARQIAIAMNVAAFRAKNLRLVCVDGLEALDEDTYKTFEEQAAKSGLQFVVNRVTRGALQVRTVDGAAEAA